MAKRYQEGDRLFAFEYNQLLDDVDILKENSGSTEGAGIIYDEEKDSIAEGVKELIEQEDFTTLNAAYGIRSHAEGMGVAAIGDSSHAEGEGFIVKITDCTFSWNSGSNIVVASEEVSLDIAPVLMYEYPNSTERLYFAVKSIGDDRKTIETDNWFDFSATDVNLWVVVHASYGDASHVEGTFNRAFGDGSHVEGKMNETKNETEHAEGNYNKSNKASDMYGNSGNTQHSIGIGKHAGDNRNAFEVMQNGDAYLFGVGGYDGTNPQSATTIQNAFVKLSILTQAEYDALVQAGTVDAGTLYVISDAQ